MDSWTPEAVLRLILGLWQAGVGLAIVLSLWFFWYSACRYGWPWRRKPPQSQ